MRSPIGLSLSALVLAVVGCATAPKSKSEQTALVKQASSTLSAMRARDPGLTQVLDNSAGYAVFPSIGKAGFAAGAAYGRGVLYVNGEPTGFVELNQGSFGAQIGAETFSELIVLRSPAEVSEMQGGKFSVGANAQAVALTTGAAKNAHFDQGVAVFIVPRGGLMAEISISGQKINYEPMNRTQTVRR